MLSDPPSQAHVLCDMQIYHMEKKQLSNLICFPGKPLSLCLYQVCTIKSCNKNSKMDYKIMSRREIGKVNLSLIDTYLNKML